LIIAKIFDFDYLAVRILKYFKIFKSEEQTPGYGPEKGILIKNKILFV